MYHFTYNNYNFHIESVNSVFARTKVTSTDRRNNLLAEAWYPVGIERVYNCISEHSFLERYFSWDSFDDVDLMMMVGLWGRCQRLKVHAGRSSYEITDNYIDTVSQGIHFRMMLPFIKYKTFRDKTMKSIIRVHRKVDPVYCQYGDGSPYHYIWDGNCVLAVHKESFNKFTSYEYLKDTDYFKTGYFIDPRLHLRAKLSGKIVHIEGEDCRVVLK